jgi:hypothetical protein
MDTNGLTGVPPTNSLLPPGTSDRLKAGPEAEFLAYMEKTPAERMRETWLGSRGLTEEDLKAMSPEKREALEKQIAEDIKAQMIEEARAKALKTDQTKMSLSSFLATTI